MIDISHILTSSTYTPAFKKALTNIDTNHDGQISAHEAKAASMSMMDELSHVAHGHGMSIVREIALLKGTYKSMLTGQVKSTVPGGGGRFSLMVDTLMDRGYTEPTAKIMAAKIGRAKYSWM